MSLQVLAATALAVLSGSTARAASLFALPPSLVPVRSERARLLVSPIVKAMGDDPGLLKLTQERPNERGHIEYIFETPRRMFVLFDANSGQMHVDAGRMSIAAAAGAKAPPLERPVLLRKARQYISAFYPQPGSLTLRRIDEKQPTAVEVQADGSSMQVEQSATFFCDFWGREAAGAATENRCMIELRPQNGALNMFASTYRAIALPKPMLSQGVALDSARFALSKGQPTQHKILLPSEAQALALQGSWSTWSRTPRQEEAILHTEEDAWLHVRTVWEFVLNIARVSVDAGSGQVVNTQEDAPLLSSLGEPFKVDAPFVYANPLPRAPKDVPNDNVKVKMNSWEIGGPVALHFPPIIRDSQPLICAEYLPAFLIKHTREGQVLYLRGLLPKEGKTARLTLGSKHARISGEELELEAAPIEVEGRLYVPASLLQRVNGVLVRWEQKPKTLWIDTRYLRRP